MWQILRCLRAQEKEKERKSLKCRSFLFLLTIHLLSYIWLSDGVNFDFEDELEAGSAESAAYTRLFKLTAAEFHRLVPGSQVRVRRRWW